MPLRAAFYIAGKESFMIEPFGMGIMFSIVPVIVIIGFVFVFGTIIARSIHSAKQWKQDNDSPVLTVPATVVAKRADVSYHHRHDHDMHAMNRSYSTTSYYATFQVESGDRMELRMKDTEYGMLVEGDAGKLTFQGKRYLQFERQR